MSLPNKSFYWRNQVINYGLVLIFCTGIFILDFYSPRGLAIGMLYCIVVLYSWLIPGKYVTPLLTLAVSILLLVAGVGGGQPPLQATENYLALNKILSLIAIWITASVVSLAKRSLERLELSKANLELKILARTRELRKSEETFRLMVNELKNHALILLNQRGEIEQWNTAATALTGYSESEVLAQHYKLFFEKEYLEIQAPSQMLFKALDEGKFVGEGWVLGKDNKRIWSEITVIPILGLKSSHNGFILLASDLSERRVKDRLKLSNAVLKAKKGELEQFVFAASHNLQEPLRNIKLLSSHLQANKAEGGNNLMDKLSHEASRAEALIQSLIAYAKTDEQVDFKNVGLKYLLGEIIAELKSTFSNMEVEVALEGDFPEVFGNRSDLKIAFHQILLNAFQYKHVDRDLELKITGKRKTETVEITIADNGQGIKKPALDKIFQVFQSGIGARKSGHQGMGLARAKKIIETHLGSIWAKSEYDVGSIFHIVLPLN